MQQPLNIYIKFYTPNKMDDNIPAASPTEANPKASNHIASVPDLDKAVKWYHEVLGFNIVTETYGRQR